VHAIFDCLIREIELSCDFLVRQTTAHHLDELLFPARQAEGMASLQAGGFRLRRRHIFEKHPTKAGQDKQLRSLRQTEQLRRRPWTKRP